jgi:hypothetical protein
VLAGLGQTNAEDLVMTMPLGDWATWTGVVVTLGALLAAAGVLRIELMRDRDARSAAARNEQANLVAAWDDRRDPDSFATIRNGSQLPVYDVELLIFDSEARNLLWTARFPVVPPAETVGVFVVQHSQTGADIRGGGSTVGPHRVVVDFRDAANRRWKRDLGGRLVPVVFTDSGSSRRAVRKSMKAAR